MKIVLYYAALNPNGSSGRIVARLQEKIKMQIDFKNMADQPDPNEIASYDFIIFLVATYGDQELQGDIEKFLVSIEKDLSGKRFSICEMGNYYGYDDYYFGSGQIIQNHLISRHAQRQMRIAPVDSLPKMDWWAVDHWISELAINLEG
jgi:flavodoxin